MEITGVVSAMGAGAGMRKGEPWIGSFHLIAWRQGDGAVTLEELRVEQPLGHGDNALDRWKNKPDPRSTVRLRVTVPEKNATSWSTAQIVEYFGVVSDPALEAAADPILYPPDFIDPDLGQFKANDMLTDLFEKQHPWLGHDIGLSLSAMKREDLSVGAQIARQLLADPVGWQAKAEMTIQRDLYALWTDVWQQDRPDLSPIAFAKAMQLQSISIESDGSFTFWLDDGDLFWGHSVLVAGDLKNGFSDAEIAG